MSSNRRSCCCGCGDSPCSGEEYRYDSTSGSCPICAIGRFSQDAGWSGVLDYTPLSGECAWKSGRFEFEGDYAPWVAEYEEYNQRGIPTVDANFYKGPSRSNVSVGDYCLDVQRPLPIYYEPGEWPEWMGGMDPPSDSEWAEWISRDDAFRGRCQNPPHCGDFYDQYDYYKIRDRQGTETEIGCWENPFNWSSDYWYDQLDGCSWKPCWRYHPANQGRIDSRYGLANTYKNHLQRCGGPHMEPDQRQQGCGDGTGWGSSAANGYPVVQYYQFNPPWGRLPWSPQVMNDWNQNWEGPLEPQGDCHMRCTPDNIGCHGLAFIGYLGNRWGSHLGGSIDNAPYCGSDVVSVPPNRGQNDEGWLWIRDWVKSGGKLVIMGESYNTELGIGCRRRNSVSQGDEFTWGISAYAEARAGWYSATNPSQMKHSEYETNKFSCMHDDWVDYAKHPDFPDVTDYAWGEHFVGEEVELSLREFAFFMADDGSGEDTEFYHVCKTESVELGDVAKCIEPEEGQQTWEPSINKLEWERDGDETPTPKMCCQRTLSSFKKDGKPFSVNTSNAAGLIPKNGGKRLVGSCDSPACTAVYKENGLGAVIVMYDSTIFGGKASQLPMRWYELAAQHSSNTENLPPEELKVIDCNNDFWKFLCEEFITDSVVGCDRETPILLEEMVKPYDENECVTKYGIAACCLPDGDCIDTNVWDCFKEKGIWQGPMENDLSGTERNFGGPDTGVQGEWDGGVFQGVNPNSQPGEVRWSQGSGCHPTCDQLFQECEPRIKGSCCKEVYEWFPECDCAYGGFGECVPTGEEIQVWIGYEDLENDSIVHDFECACNHHGRDYSFWDDNGEKIPAPNKETGFLTWEPESLRTPGECTTFDPYPNLCEEDSDCEDNLQQRCCTVVNECTGQKRCTQCPPECEENEDCSGTNMCCIYETCQECPECYTNPDCEDPELCCEMNKCVECEPPYEPEDCCLEPQICLDDEECINCECKEMTTPPPIECDCGGTASDPNDCPEGPPNTCESDEECGEGQCCDGDFTSDWCIEHPNCCPKSCGGCPCTSNADCPDDQCCSDQQCEDCGPLFQCCTALIEDCIENGGSPEYCENTLCEVCPVTPPMTLCDCNVVITGSGVQCNCESDQPQCETDADCPHDFCCKEYYICGICDNV